MNEKLAIPAKVWNGIEFSNYIEIAQEVSSDSSSMRRWIALYAMFNISDEIKNSINTYEFLKNAKDFKYCIVDFEMSKKLIDFNDGIDTRDTVNFKSLTANTEDQLALLFEKEEINPALFVPPWRCDYPL
ncbi:hypothetical protein [Serratia sp. (in: enterobacteria)]|uniref:hypothetical protein n=1 Tax=Serratia sp. (in: enterobacteria) TaxID=616 RepID=UPI003989D0E4